MPPPAPPQISTPKAPPPPKIVPNEKEKTKRQEKDDKKRKGEEDERKKEEQQKNAFAAANEQNSSAQADYSNYNMMMDPAMMAAQYQYDFTMMYQQPVFDYPQQEQELVPAPDVPLEHTLPLQPPPLPPDDPNEDLAMLGISVDDMAAQMF